MLQQIKVQAINDTYYRLTDNFNITVSYKNDTYVINVPKDFVFDGTTVPKIVYPFVGTPVDFHNGVPSCVHDFLYSDLSNDKVMCNDEYITCDRYVSDNILNELIKLYGSYKLKQWLIYYGVRIAGRYFYKKK